MAFVPPIGDGGIAGLNGWSKNAKRRRPGLVVAEKPLNWLNIALHVAMALPWAAGAGAGLQMGLAYGGAPGAALAVLSGAGGLGVARYWPLRERIQHEMDWGGRQSTWEWIGPVAVTPVGIALGWWVSRLLL